MTDKNDDIATFIYRLNDELQKQAKSCGGWPNPLRLPTPDNPAEKEALELWLEAVREETGRPVQVRYTDA